MKSNELFEINFNSLLVFTNNVDISNMDFSESAFGFCCDCENKKIIPSNIPRKISHGCDFDDYERYIGKCINLKKGPTVAFILQDPNTDIDNTDRTIFNNIEKYTPIENYWKPIRRTWNICKSDLADNQYSSYFIYLTLKHNISDFYITNMVKCSECFIKPVIENCIGKYLINEMKAFNPDFIFAFGEKIARTLDNNYTNDEIPGKLIELYHPSLFGRNNYRTQKSPDQIIDENDSRIEKRLRLTLAST